jgi:hypothetical protein
MDEALAFFADWHPHNMDGGNNNDGANANGDAGLLDGAAALAAPAAAAAAPVAANNVSVKLPDFWVDNPRTWFLSVEAAFRSSKITSEKSRFDYAVSKLPSAIISQVIDIIETPPAEAPYTALKDALTQRLTKPEAERARIALEEEHLGDRTPSQLLRHLQAMLPASDFNSAIFRLTFINKMPEAIRTQLAANEAATLTDVARQADNMLTFQRSQRNTLAAATAAGNTTAAEASLAEVVARLSLLEKGFKKKTRKYDRPTNGLCYFHDRFGDKARSCRPPCSKNGQSGSRH